VDIHRQLENVASAHLRGGHSRQRVHLVGIGGIGLSAIARILHEQGYRVSGSDAQRTALSEGLAEQGIVVHYGHRAQNVAGADLVVVSSAVPHDNPEWVAASQAGIPVVKRAQILGEMMAGRFGIAVAGTHGKTTTSAWIAFVLAEMGLDPTFIVGGILQNLGTNARSGAGPHFVVEADEYDHTFLGLRPSLAVITVIEMDHPDCFRDLEEMTEAFQRFVRLLPEGGVAIGCADQSRVLQVLESVRREKALEVITYSLGHAEADWQAQQIRANEVGGSDFQVVHQGQVVGECRLLLPGPHNVSNALAVLAVCQRLRLDLPRVLTLCSCFLGVRRRFEVKGQAGGVVVIDDYAHHPTEIKATLKAARQRYGDRAIWVFFQPHTYSRTKALLGEFAAAFEDADHVLLGEIYASREKDSLGISSQHLLSRMVHPDVRYVATLQEASRVLQNALCPGDVLLTLGAGDGYLVGEAVLRGLVARGGVAGTVAGTATGATRADLRPGRNCAAQGSMEAGSASGMDLDGLRSALGERVKVNEPMSQHTTFGIGGPADLFVVARTRAELVACLQLTWQYQVPYLVLGKGANLLVSDRGIRGLVICNECKGVDFRPREDGDWLVECESGAEIKAVAREAVTRGLAGLEWAVDIPGTVGGAVVGNAGAFGGYVSDNLHGVWMFIPGVAGTATREGERWWPSAALQLGYRTSIIKAGGIRCPGQPPDTLSNSVKRAGFGPVILTATFALRTGDANQLAQTAAGYSATRRERQPQGRSAGSVFKRTAQYPAGFLIENAGLKGLRVGGAVVSSLHANFIINEGSATANDVRSLIEIIRETVRDKFKTALELEIELVGDWEPGWKGRG